MKYIIIILLSLYLVKSELDTDFINYNPSVTYVNKENVIKVCHVSGSKAKEILSYFKANNLIPIEERSYTVTGISTNFRFILSKSEIERKYKLLPTVISEEDLNRLCNDVERILLTIGIVIAIIIIILIIAAIVVSVQYRSSNNRSSNNRSSNDGCCCCDTCTTLICLSLCDDACFCNDC